MSRFSCDRHYLPVPAQAAVVESVATATERSAADLAVFRAALLYIASDLRQIACTAPVERREQVNALGALAASIATR